MVRQIKGWTGTHWAVLGACLTSIAALVASLKTWSEALSPLFVAGVIGVIGSQLQGLRVAPPKE